jgi:beta-lactamase regulating signal transducer with metallopeptidase domain
MSYGPYLTHGITLAFVWYAGINIAACVAITIAMRALDRGRVGAPAFWLTARLFPTVTAAAFVLLLFGPSYWKYEPRESVEGFDLALTMAAAVGVAAIVAGLARGAAAWRSAVRRSRDWMRHARPIAFANTSLPAYVIDAHEPMLALVGVLRPRILVTRGLVEALTGPELAASVAHELGHQRALDNLKRLAMRSAPDLLDWLGIGREIERRWAVAAERAADRDATGADAVERCRLASALVKVARLMPICVPANEPICTLVAGGDITLRVQTLLADAPAETTDRGSALAWITAGLGVALAAVSYSPLLRAVHEVTEVLVRVTGGQF